MIDWLRKKGNVKDSSLSDKEREEYEMLKMRYKELEVKTVSEQVARQCYDEESGSEDNEEKDDFVEDAVLQTQITANKNKPNRTSVSAEAFGVFNKREDYKARVIEKNQDSKNRIRTKLDESFMFRALEDKEKDVVIGAMEEKRFKSGDNVIKQGEEGDCLYLVEEGELDCFKKFPDKDQDTHLKVYQPGEAFGELCLLYNAPRAATIVAKTDALCWALDRPCFNNIVKVSAQKKREQYENFLSKVELLESMDPYERSKLCDAFTTEKFTEGQSIIKQGDSGDKFYFVMEGECVALKSEKEGDTPQQVMTYGEGAYFGELALLKNAPRAATVQAKGDVKVVSMERRAFKRLLGPLEAILQRNMEKYKQIISE